MKILTVFAHPGSGSFCHAILERFDAGLREAGHTNEIVDLYAIGFDPVLRERDNPNWMDADAPDDVLASMHLRERLFATTGGPLRRLAMKRWLGDRDTSAIIRMLQERFDAPWLVKAAGGLPGGIGNIGEECGGVTAPLMLLGLRHARAPLDRGLPIVVYKGHTCCTGSPSAMARCCVVKFAATAAYR